MKFFNHFLFSLEKPSGNLEMKDKVKDDNEMQEMDQDQEIDMQSIPSNATFLGCEYLHIKYESEEQVKYLISLTLDQMKELDLVIDLNYEESDSEDETDTQNLGVSALSSLYPFIL